MIARSLVVVGGGGRIALGFATCGATHTRGGLPVGAMGIGRLIRPTSFLHCLLYM